MPPKDIVQPRRGTAAEWAAKTPSPVLKLGELGVETDTHRMKIGDGVTAWSSLGYIAGTFDLENVPMQVARDTTANLEALTDPFLSGQIVYDQTTGRMKIGDGETLWPNLPDPGKQFKNVITVAKDGVKGSADFICSDSAYASDDECFQAAINSIISKGHGILHLYAGHYIFYDNVDFTSGDICIEGEGPETILDFSNIPSYRYIYVHGSISDTNSLLTSNASAGDLTITVEDGTKFSADDYIRIRSDAIFQPRPAESSPWIQHVGEIQQIASIDGNILTLRETLFGEYNTSDNATVDIINMLQNVAFMNFSIISTPGSNAGFGISITQCKNVYIENVYTQDVHNFSIYLSDVVGCVCHSCTAIRSNTVGLGYGIAVTNASRDIIAFGNHYYDCRHGITCGGDHTYGVQYNQTYFGNTASYASQPIGMFGMHPSYDGLTVFGNICQDTALGYFDGLNNVIVSNIAKNVRGAYGIKIPSASSHSLVENNRVTTIDFPCIYINNVTYGDTTIRNNNLSCETAAVTGIYTDGIINNLVFEQNRVATIGSAMNITTEGAISDSSYLWIINNKLLCGENVSAIDVAIESNYNISNVKIKDNTTKITGSSAKNIQCHRSSGAFTGSFTGVSIRDNELTNGINGIYITSTTDCDIYHNKITSCTTGIGTTPTCSNFKIRDNQISGATTAISDYSGAVISGNDGYTTENTGIATIPASSTYITVDHGLVAAPAKYFAFPAGDIGYCWIDTVTSTQLTIHCKTAPASNTLVSWLVKV